MNAKSAKNKRFNWSYIFIGCALIVLAVIGIRTVSTPDTYMHLVTGRTIAQEGIPRVDTLSYTTADTPWVATSWLYDLILYKVWQIGGAPLATLLTIILVGGAFAVLFPVVKRWSGEVPAALSLLLCAWMIAPLFRVSPSMATLIFPAIFIAVLSRKMNTVTGIICLVVAQVFWTNLNGSFLWGPVIALAFTAQTYFSNSKKDKSLAATLGFNKMLMLTVGLLIATLVNPYFLSLHKAVIDSITDPAAIMISFWISPLNILFSADMTRHLRVVILIIGAAGLIVQREKLPIALTSLAVLTAFLVVRSLQQSALFAIIAFPFICLCMNAVGVFLAQRISGSENSPMLSNIGRAAIVLLAVVSFFAIMTNSYYIRSGNTSSFGLGEAENVKPSEDAIAFIKQNVPAGKAVNTFFDGPVLKWNIPEYEVFCDTRSSVYGLDFYRDAVNGLNGADSKVFFGKWMPQAIILNSTYQQAGLVARNLTLNGWSLVYFDGLTAVYMPRVKDFAQLITDQNIKKKGLALLNDQLTAYRDQLDGTIQPPLPANLIGAANLLLANGNFKEAGSIFATITRGVPMMTAGWINLGRSQLEQDKPEKAIESLSQAVELAPENVYALLLLAKANENAGNSDDAEQLYAEAETINAEMTKAFQETDGQKQEAIEEEL